jgi:hypothetical protein
MKREHKTVVKSFQRVRKDLQELWEKAHWGDWGAKRKIARLKFYDLLYRYLFPKKNFALTESLMMSYGVWMEKQQCSKETISRALQITPSKAKGSKKIALRILGLYGNEYSEDVITNASRIKRVVDNFINVEEAITLFFKEKPSVQRIVKLTVEEAVRLAEECKKEAEKKKKVEAERVKKEKLKIKKEKAKMAEELTRKQLLLKIAEEISDEDGYFFMKELEERLKEAGVPSSSIYTLVSRMRKSGEIEDSDGLSRIKATGVEVKPPTEKKPKPAISEEKIIEVIGDFLGEMLAYFEKNKKTEELNSCIEFLRNRRKVFKAALKSWAEKM